MVVKKMVVKKSQILKKNGGQKRVGHIPTGCHWALVWPRSKSPEMAPNGTDFFFNRVQNFQSSGVSIWLLTKKSSFRILLDMLWHVFEPLLNDFQWTGEGLDHI